MKVINLSFRFCVQCRLFDEEPREAHHHPCAHGCLRSGLLVVLSKLLEAILSWKATRKHIGGKLEGAHVCKLRCHALIYSRTWPAQRPATDHTTRTVYLDMAAESERSFRPAFHGGIPIVAFLA